MGAPQRSSEPRLGRSVQRGPRHLQPNTADDHRHDDRFAFALDQPPNGPGDYVFHAVNAGKYPHAVELDGAGVSDQKSSTVQPGGTTDLAATLQAGDLDMYCPVDDHRTRGMETHSPSAPKGVAPVGTESRTHRRAGRLKQLRRQTEADGYAARRTRNSQHQRVARMLLQ